MTATQIEFVTEYGAYGPYKVGVEYTVDAAGVHHTVKRPEYVERFVGYGVFDGQVLAVTAAGHYGPLSAWRMIGSDETEIRVIAQPSNAPRLNLPDEEHGHTWGDPVVADLPSTDSVKCLVAGRVIDVGAALMALADHASLDSVDDDNRPGVPCAHHREDCAAPGCRKDHRDPPQREHEPFLIGSDKDGACDSECPLHAPPAPVSGLLTVIASNPRPSTCCTTPGALDVDVHCSIPGQAGHLLPLSVGGVTVAPRQSDGRLAGYGPSPDHWLTGALLAQLRRLSDAVGSERLDLDTALDDILTAAVDAAK